MGVGLCGAGAKVYDQSIHGIGIDPGGSAGDQLRDGAVGLGMVDADRDVYGRQQFFGAERRGRLGGHIEPHAHIVEEEVLQRFTGVDADLLIGLIDGFPNTARISHVGRIHLRERGRRGLFPGAEVQVYVCAVIRCPGALDHPGVGREGKGR